MQAGDAEVGEQAQPQPALEPMVLDQNDPQARQTHAPSIPR